MGGAYGHVLSQSQLTPLLDKSGEAVCEQSMFPASLAPPPHALNSAQVLMTEIDAIIAQFILTGRIDPHGESATGGLEVT